MRNIAKEPDADLPTERNEAWLAALPKAFSARMCGRGLWEGKNKPAHYGQKFAISFRRLVGARMDLARDGYPCYLRPRNSADLQTSSLCGADGRSKIRLGLRYWRKWRRSRVKQSQKQVARH
jgi:hypothetical protein